MDLSQVNEALSIYIRPQTFPLAIRLCRSEGELPQRARRPLRDLGFVITLCQALGMARRYGWLLALDVNDQACPYGSLALGFLPPKAAYLTGGFAESLASGAGAHAARSALALPRLEHGAFSHVLMAPLHSASFDPDVVVVYGNSAQVMRLVQGRLHGQGGALTSSASGGMDCADIVAQTILSDECQFVLPCNGDRIFGMTQDDEMAFAMPASKVVPTLEGLEASHRSGAQRYPIPSFLRFAPQLPDSYNKLLEFLKK